MRVSSNRLAKNGGWLHSLGAAPVQYQKHKPEPARPAIDAAKIMREFAADTKPSELNSFAESLGVTADSLRAMGCQRAKRHSAWAFPMSDARGDACGIRLRTDSGKKFAVTGSRGGIFLPSLPAQHRAWIVEGASDTAALLSMQLWGFGRPQCSGSIPVITTTLSRLNIKEVCIIADNDDPGINGAKLLSNELDIPNLIFIPPLKDLRSSFIAGLTSGLLSSLIQNQAWNQPVKTKRNFEIVDSFY